MILRRSLPLLFAVLLLDLALPAPASAGVPNPTTSTVPSCLTICPSGDRPFSIVVRDAISAPVVGASVVLDLSSCPNAVIAPCDRCAQTTE